MNIEFIWEALSYSWTEIGLANEEYDSIVKKAEYKHSDYQLLLKNVFWVFPASFAVFTTLSLLTVGAILPDWFFDEGYVVSKVKKWKSRPLILSLVNPVWLVGYPIAIIIVLKDWYKIKKSL